MKKALIIGAGPSGLFCAYQLLKKGVAVDLFDQMSGVGKKLLIAGKSGLNLTHGEDLDSFVQKYGKNSEQFKDLVQDFGPEDVRKWCKSLGVETFIGSSQRVFPKEMKAARLLSNWMKELKIYENFNLFLNHKLIKICENKKITFINEDSEVLVSGDWIIFATGGASWKKTGSDGLWVNLFKDKNVEILPFTPMNCGFLVNWSKNFIETVDRSHIKNVEVTCNDMSNRSELMLTPYGIEGTAIYSLSSKIRDLVVKNKIAKISLDLRPDLSQQQVYDKFLKKRNKDSMSNFLRKAFNFDKASISLLREVLPKEHWNSFEKISLQIKNLNIQINGIRPIDEAISTGGGVDFSELTTDLEFKKLKGFYAIGEMLDFEAPTGGYLLQGCFSSAYRAARSIIEQAFL